MKQKIGLPIPVSKYKWWDKTMPLFTKGEYPDGKKASVEGGAPIKFQYYADKDGTKLSPTPTEYLTSIPTLTNADTLGIRPDLIGRKIESWAELINPQFKGKAALVDESDIGILDAVMALEAAGAMKYGDKGNLSKAEIDKTIAALIDLKKGGQFRSFWQNFDQSVSLMASGEVVIQSMWSPAVTAVRTRGIACEFVPLKEGYRGWGVTLVPLKHLAGAQARRRHGIPQLVQFRLAGRLHRAAGLLRHRPRDHQGVPGAVRVGLLVRGQAGGAGHQGSVRQPHGEGRQQARRRRAVGAHGQCRGLELPHGRAALPHKRWNEFISA